MNVRSIVQCSRPGMMYAARPLKAQQNAPHFGGLVLSRNIGQSVDFNTGHRVTLSGVNSKNGTVDLTVRGIKVGDGILVGDDVDIRVNKIRSPRQVALDFDAPAHVTFRRSELDPNQ